MFALELIWGLASLQVLACARRGLWQAQQAEAVEVGGGPTVTPGPDVEALRRRGHGLLAVALLMMLVNVAMRLFGVGAPGR